MKKLLFSSLILLIFAISVTLFQLSCTNDTIAQSQSTNTSIKYKLNGTLIQINGSLLQTSKEGSVMRKEYGSSTETAAGYRNFNNPGFHYHLFATTDYGYTHRPNDIRVSIYINTPTLATGTYTFTGNKAINVFLSGAETLSSDFSYPNQRLGCEFVLNITQIA